MILAPVDAGAGSHTGLSTSSPSYPDPSTSSPGADPSRSPWNR